MSRSPSPTGSEGSKASGSGSASSRAASPAAPRTKISLINAGERSSAGGAGEDDADALALSTGDPAASSAPVLSFKDLGLDDDLCEACASLGYKQPSEIQRECIPYALQGKDIIGLAQTGSGKTAAFALPILQALSNDPSGLFACVLAPTRYGAPPCGSSDVLQRIGVPNRGAVLGAWLWHRRAGRGHRGRHGHDGPVACVGQEAPHCRGDTGSASGSSREHQGLQSTYPQVPRTCLSTLGTSADRCR